MGTVALRGLGSRSCAHEQLDHWKTMTPNRIRTCLFAMAAFPALVALVSGCTSEAADERATANTPAATSTSSPTADAVITAAGATATPSSATASPPPATTTPTATPTATATATATPTAEPVDPRKPLTATEEQIVNSWFDDLNAANQRAGRFGSDIAMARTLNPDSACSVDNTFATRYADYLADDRLRVEWTTHWQPRFDQSHRTGSEYEVVATVTDTVDGIERQARQQLRLQLDLTDESTTATLLPDADFCEPDATLPTSARPIKTAVLAALDGTGTRSSTSSPNLPAAPWNTGPVTGRGAVAAVTAAWASNYGQFFPGCRLYSPTSSGVGRGMADLVLVTEPQASRIGDMQFGFSDGGVNISVSIWPAGNDNVSTMIEQSSTSYRYRDDSTMYVSQSGSVFLIDVPGQPCYLEVMIFGANAATRSHIISSVRPIG